MMRLLTVHCRNRLVSALSKTSSSAFIFCKAGNSSSNLDLSISSMAFSHPISNPSIFLPIVILILASLYQPSHGFSRYGRGMAENNSTRRLFGSRAAQPITCGDLVVQSQCSKNRCSWCRSEVLDDMCFSRTEAWRLPPEIFSCG